MFFRKKEYHDEWIAKTFGKDRENGPPYLEKIRTEEKKPVYRNTYPKGTSMGSVSGVIDNNYFGISCSGVSFRNSDFMCSG